MIAVTSDLRITDADIREELARRRYNKMDFMFPDKGAFRRELYSKHMEVVAQTAVHRQVCMMSANRIGKTELGGYMVAVWATGRYPEWWTGKRFNGAVNIMVAGETGTLVRDSVQEKMLGPITDIGSGMIPKHLILEKKVRPGIPNAFDTVHVRHVDGGVSIIQFQSYDQGREKFQATARHVVWDDEEPPLDVYSEQIMRTMTTGGVVLSTFTPLKGVSMTVIQLQKQAREDNAAIITATWDDAPHLSEEDKTDLMKSLPPHQRDARSKGVPSLGSGAVYPVPESEFVVSPFEIPKHWKHAYGFDVGWNNTAAVWGALDPESGVAYITHDYKKGQAEPAVHASAIRARGDWIPGVVDPASRGRSQADGEQLIWLYRQQGLDLSLAENGVESGIFEVYERLTVGKLKVFKSCMALLEEYRLYRRDDKGKVVKENDHCMDALRYYVKSGISVSKPFMGGKKARLLGIGSLNPWAQ